MHWRIFGDAKHEAQPPSFGLHVGKAEPFPQGKRQSRVRTRWVTLMIVLCLGAGASIMSQGTPAIELRKKSCILAQL